VIKEDNETEHQLTVAEIRAILKRERVAESTGVLVPDREKMNLCVQVLHLLGEPESK